MEKECSCKKLIKEDKITLITECKVCIKKRRKDTKLLLSVLDKLIELRKHPTPKYKTGGVSCVIVNDSKEPTPKMPEDYKNWFVCEGKNTSVKDWLESLKPKQEFHKQMLEADKELQRVCSICNKYKYIAKYDNAKEIIVYTAIPKTCTRDTNDTNYRF